MKLSTFIFLTHPCYSTILCSYNVHHDYIDVDTERQPGPRILTVFLYLNEVEEGGGTQFLDLNITVMPKVGRALLWPSVLDEDPTKKDDRTYHQALPVEKGVKFGSKCLCCCANYCRSSATPIKPFRSALLL